MRIGMFGGPGPGWDPRSSTAARCRSRRQGVGIALLKTGADTLESGEAKWTRNSRG